MYRCFRLGNITLGDFKEVFDRPGPFRFHFKALDPEFGTVKEEVIDLLLHCPTRTTVGQCSSTSPDLRAKRVADDLDVFSL